MKVSFYDDVNEKWTNFVDNNNDLLLKDESRRFHTSFSSTCPYSCYLHAANVPFNTFND